MNIIAKDKLRNVWVTLGKTWNQASGYWTVSVHFSPLQRPHASRQS